MDYKRQFQPQPPQPPKQRESVLYKSGWGTAGYKYRKDFKKRKKQGWTLVSCTQTGHDWFGREMLTAVYER